MSVKVRQRNEPPENVSGAHHLREVFKLASSTRVVEFLAFLSSEIDLMIPRLVVDAAYGYFFDRVHVAGRHGCVPCAKLVGVVARKDVVYQENGTEHYLHPTVAVVISVAKFCIDDNTDH